MSARRRGAVTNDSDGDDTLVDELLRRQAAAHGLPAFTPDAADAAEPALKQQLAEEAQLLPSFAGFRRNSNSPAFVQPSTTGPLSAYADAADPAEELHALGLDVLKAELMRCGVKCGGTVAERATRLFALKGLTATDSVPLDLRAGNTGGPKSSEGVSAGAKRVPQQGPLLPGAKRGRVTKRT